MSLITQSISDFLAALRRPEPVPGGGSAAALSGAAGASLLALVAGLPKPRATDPADVAALRAAGERCVALAERLEALIDRDSEAYERVVAAYRLPRATEEEKRVRAARIQAGLRAAIEAPLDVMGACAAALNEAAVAAASGNANAASDVRVALELLSAGLRGAAANVDINLGSVKDEAWSAVVRGDLQRLRHAGDAAIERAAGELDARR
ncbi:MAG TPA: cyclodeaminase/cyclohydrolase family protein [Vicinamibacterales bacterium]|nr:cyclodeaminase/cyclohydrolase family protein [Vicinamibacterales bacterium]